MRKYLLAWIVLAVAGLALIAGCGQLPAAIGAVTDGSGTVPSDTPPEATTAGTGAIRLYAPSVVAPWVVTDKEDVPSGPVVTKGAADLTRCLMIGTTVMVDLYSESIGYVGTMNLTDVEGFASGPYVWSGLPEDVYYLEVYVLNENNPEGQEFTVGGYNTAAVYADQYTEVAVTCFPFGALGLEDGYFSSEVYRATMGEAWFVFFPDSSTTRVACNSSSGDMDLFVFGPDGLFTGYGSVSVEPAEYVDMPTVPGAMYFVGMFSYSEGYGAIGFASPVPEEPGGPGDLGIIIQ